MRSFIPNYPKKGDFGSVCTERWYNFTNMNAEMTFYGFAERNGMSYKFKNYMPQEIEQNISLYIFKESVLVLN